MLGFTGVWLSLGSEDEPGDDAEASEGSSSSSREKEGTTWGGEIGGAVAGGGASCAICRGSSTKGAMRSNRRWKRGTAKPLQKKEVKMEATGPADICRVDH